MALKEEKVKELGFKTDASIRWLSRLSFGQNFCLLSPKNPEGWSPERLVEHEYDRIYYQFFDHEFFPGYSKKDYEEFVKDNPEVEKIIEEGRNQDRFAVTFVEQDYRIYLGLRRTQWVPLQYHWNYFRNADQNIRNKAYTRLSQIHEHEILLNSFCLHLIIETEDGVVLSQIGTAKKNDHPSTLAVTLGEQIEENDFWKNKKFCKDFVRRWTKRAVKEELGVSEEEYAEYFDPESLKVLGINVEADIYNIALCCSVKLRKSVTELENKQKNSPDSFEIRTLKEISTEEAKIILESYPDNQAEYHPSSYLRLLLFLRERGSL